MKKSLLFAIATALVLHAKAQSYTPVTLTGFTADVIANGSGPATASTNNDVDTVDWAFVAQNFVNSTGQSPTAGSALPNNGIINSIITATPGLTFQLAPYTGNNSLRISPGNSGILTFATPLSATDLYVFLTPATYATSLPLTLTVNFTDGTNQAFTGISLGNWYGGTGYAWSGSTRVKRATNGLDVQTAGPRIFQQKLTLSAANASKTIQSIRANNNSTATTSGILNVMAVTAATTFATDAGITAISGSNSGCALTNQETITISVKNFGTTAQSNIPVSYSINGTVTGTGIIAGPLAAGATTTYSFTTKANLSSSGTYSIVAKTTLANDAFTPNDATTISVTNYSLPALPINLDFETPSTGLVAFRKTTNARSAVVEGVGASNGTGTKGLIMDGITNTAWVIPAGTTNPWTTNPTYLASIKMCFNPAGGNASDPLWLSFDLKQLFKTTNANTNFRVLVNGTPVGGNMGTSPANTYRPPFSGSPITWQRINIDLTSYKSQPNIEITFESSVKEEYANGAGTANLIDNIQVRRSAPAGVKETVLSANLQVFPNPSNGVFKVSLPENKTYSLEVADLTGKVIQHKVATGETELKLENKAKGIYLLKVVSENQTATRKLIVE